VQVHTGDEGTKNGLAISDVDEMLKFLATECPKLQFRGFMGMGKLHDRDGFQQIRKIAEGTGLPDLILSMGTSADYEMAIEEGATEVRLGSTIFGERNYPAK
jgi:PLP dependent protein